MSARLLRQGRGSHPRLRATAPPARRRGRGESPLSQTVCCVSSATRTAAVAFIPSRGLFVSCVRAPSHHRPSITGASCCFNIDIGTTQHGFLDLVPQTADFGPAGCYHLTALSNTGTCNNILLFEFSSISKAQKTPRLVQRRVASIPSRRLFVFVRLRAFTPRSVPVFPSHPCTEACTPTRRGPRSLWKCGPTLIRRLSVGAVTVG